MTIHFNDPLKAEIWTVVRAMNDCWTQGNPDELVDYFHRDMIAVTPADRERRVGAAACVAGWKQFAQSTHIYYWREIDPLIQVYGDSAIVVYYFEISFDMGGQTLTTEGRDMFFFIKENGRWWAVADQFSPYPA